MAEDESVPPEIIIQPEQMAGVWANFAQVGHSPYEFTLDFVRMEFGPQPRGIVVARVSVSPLFISELITALQDNWDKFAKKALPQEVYLDPNSGSESSAPPPAAGDGDDDASDARRDRPAAG